MSDTTATASVPKRGGSLGRFALVLLAVALFVGLPLARFLFQPEPEIAVAPPAPVVVGSAFRADAELLARYTGNLVPESATTVVPKANGRLVEMLVSENQFVQAGTLLARLEDEVLRIQLAQARAAYDAADAQYRQALRGVRSTELEIAAADVEQAGAELETARSAAARSERLFEAGAIPRSEYESALDRFSAAETSVQNARRQLTIMQDGLSEEELDAARANADAALRHVELAELQLSYAQITAPVAGTISAVLAEEGQLLGPSTPLVSIVNDRLIHARIDVPERLYGQFRGREGELVVRVFPEAYSQEEPFLGRVTTVAGTIDASSRTFQVEVAIPNADGRLRPGMFVNAHFVVETYPDALQIPDTALTGVNAAGDGAVLLFEEGLAVLRQIQVIDVPGPSTVVLAGLSETDLLILEGGAFLSSGERVEVVDQR